MQNPVGAQFNMETMRMELTSVADLIFNPVAQVKFVHTVAAGYTVAASFVLGVSAYYLLRGRDVAFASRSFAVAAGFGLASILSVIVLGDESGYTSGEVQKMKLATIEAEWETHEAPAGITVFGIPNQEEERTDYAIKIPWLLGLIATRSIDEEVAGIKELKDANQARIRDGIRAYAALQRIRGGDRSAEAMAEFDATKQHLGYGLLLKKYTPDVIDATEEQILRATDDTVPKVWVMFWAFRVMVGCGFALLFVFVLSFYACAKRRITTARWPLRLAVWTMPLPWIAVEVGWIVAEYGRQPWTISEVLPTHLSASSLSTGDLYFSLAGFVGFYTFLLVIEVFLMLKYIRLGPSSLHTGRYHHEQEGAPALAR
jgi:cytochrome d ubiquinol oxidase subunit I